MRYLALLLAAALALTMAAEESCTEGDEARIYSVGNISLHVASHILPSDAVVPIRTRASPFLPIVYSAWDELPESIGGPSSAKFPLMVHTKHGSDVDAASATLGDLAAAASALLEAELTAHGAVLFRGLPLADGEDLSRLVSELSVRMGWRAVKLSGGGTQRQDVSFNVRTASEEPAEHTIEPHMDMAHSIAHPKRIAFFCAAGPPAGVGGETVLTDMRSVYITLDALGIPSKFAAHGGVAYHKRLWSAEAVAHSYTWQQFFFTQDLETAVHEVRRRDPNARVDRATGTIEFAEMLPAVFPHPVTGEPLWFNGIHTNHKSYYEEALHVDTSGGSPMHTTFADGEEIPERMIAIIRAAIWNHSVATTLQSGDLILVDNMLASHGRMGWISGHPRKVLLSHLN